MADSIAGAVASALAQEVVGRVVSLVLLAGTGKREEKAPAAQVVQARQQHIHNVERLKMAVSQLEFALERTGKLPITDVSLLNQRKMFKVAYLEGTGLLLTSQQRQRRHRHQLQDQDDDDDDDDEEEEEEANRQQIKRRRRWILSAMARPFKTSSSSSSASSSSSSPSSIIIIGTDVVRRFEWFADCAGRFVRDVVESGSTLRHHSFFFRNNPVVRRLLEGKQLRYETVTTDQGGGASVLRFLDLWPLCVEGRGVETIFEYRYQDRGAPEKNLLLHAVLRLSESTDIFGTVIACLRAMASRLKLQFVSEEAAVGELALLSTSVDMGRSVVPRQWARIDEGDYTRASQSFRHDPVCCCRENDGQGHVPRARGSPELSWILPEQIIVLAFWCCVPAPDECGLALPSTSSSRCWKRPPLKMTVFFSPHASYHDPEEEGEDQEQRRTRSWALDLAATGESGNPSLLRDVSVKQVAEMVRPKALDCFLRQPHLPLYAITWGSQHGKAIFIVEKPASTAKEQVHGLLPHKNQKNPERIVM